MADNNFVDRGIQVTFRLDAELAEWAKDKAARQHRSMASVVREAVAVMAAAETERRLLELGEVVR